MERKRYEDQNPWISFEFKVQMDTLWALLGEAYSKTQHLVGTSLPPGFARELASVYLRRGALASTAIEGNTLSLDELNKIMDEGHKLPPSQEYLEREVANVLSALDVVCKTAKPGAFLLSPEWIMRQNATILDGLDVDDHVEPGEYTTKQLVVGAYRAAPPQDVPYLVDRLCRWLNEEYISRANAPGTPEDQRFYLAFLAAALGHLYVAWIHPFGDGNGRTARILQAAVLANSGVVPWVSVNLLSDFYNRTRTRYYRALADASERGDVAGFIRYSAQGYVDQLREQIEEAQRFQRRIAWQSYVHEVMRAETSGKAKDRRRELVLAMPEEPIPRKDIPSLSKELYAAYADTERTLSRDLARLLKLELVRAEGRGGWAANTRVMDAFMPGM